jgi:hypothetical protein
VLATTRSARPRVVVEVDGVPVDVLAGGQAVFDGDALEPVRAAVRVSAPG